MKTVLFFLALVLAARASELAFEVVDEAKTWESRQWQNEILLDAYDSLATMIETGVFAWEDYQGRHEIAANDGKLTCDASAKILRVTFPQELSDEDLHMISQALQVAVLYKRAARQTADIDFLQKKMQVAWDAHKVEKDSTRARILRDLVSSYMPPLDGPSDSPFVGLRRMANQTPRPTHTEGPRG